MLHEEEGTNHIGSVEVPTCGSWPPPDHGQSKHPMGFMTKVTRGPGGRPVEWPPRCEFSRSQEQLDQVPARHLPSEPAPPPVPPRPANYPQAKMDQVQVQQQHHQQQVVMQQQQQEQQHRQQVSSSMQIKTVKQVQQFQTYEQQQSSGGTQGSVQYQLPPQQLEQSLQHQMPQQNSSSAAQHAPPASMEHHIPIQLASGPPEHHVPIHGGVPTPFVVNQNSMALPKSANQNASFPSQYANHNVAPSQQFTNGNNALQHDSYPNAGVPPQYADAQNVDAQHPSEPYYASGTTQDKPDGYTTAYNTIRGEWPPKQENEAPNLTTTYPSGFKLKDQAGFQTGPAKVVTSQPAFKITQPIRRSGDDKWPPKGSAEPTQEEIREFVKPKKSNRNYEEFFAQNALPHNYAGYRPPPGTQHFGSTADGLSDM